MRKNIFNIFRIFLSSRFGFKSILYSGVFSISFYSLKIAYGTTFERNKNSYQIAKDLIVYIFDNQNKLIAIGIILDMHVVFYLTSNEIITKIKNNKDSIYATKIDEKEKLKFSNVIIKEDENLIFAKLEKKNSSEITQTKVEKGDNLTFISYNLENETEMYQGIVSENYKLTQDFPGRTYKINSIINKNENNCLLAINSNGEFSGFLFNNNLRLIPSQHIFNLLKFIKENKNITRPYLGMSLKEEKLENIKKGLMVVNIFDNSPAQKANIKMGDIIFEVDGEKVSNLSEFVNILGYEQSRTIAIKLYSKNIEKTVYLNI